MKSDEESFRVVKIRRSVQLRLKALADLWTTPTSHRLSVPNIIEILAKLVPETVTQEQIEGVQLTGRPRGRPKGTRPGWPVGTCKFCGEEMVLKGCLIEWIGPHTYGVCSAGCGDKLRADYRRTRAN